MEKRNHKRIASQKEIIIYSQTSIRFGTLANCSTNGMYIKPMISFPFDSFVEIHIPLEEDILKVPGKVVRVVKTGDIYDGMGIELLAPSENYLEFMTNIDLG